MDARDGRVCAFHGPSCPADVLVPQHRANRGMGGLKSLNRIANLVWLDSYLNELVESNALTARDLTKLGIKISTHVKPELVPVTYWDGVEYWLTPDGRRERTAQEVAF